MCWRSERTARKWIGRYRAEGELGLLDHSSAPARVPARTDEARVELIASLRRLRMTGAEIAERLGMALSTVSGILQRIGLGKLSRLEPPEPPSRYQRERPGELIHVDVKKLGRISVRGAGHRVTGSRRRRVQTGPKRLGATGWEFVHVCVDDATRLAYVEVLEDEKAPTAVGFLRRAIAFYRARGITVQRVIPTTAPPTFRSCTPSPAARWASATCAPVPIDPAPTARPNGSSRPSRPAGPTARSTAPQPNAEPPYPAGSTNTTPDDHTAPSATSPRQLASRAEQRPRVLQLGRRAG